MYSLQLKISIQWSTNLQLFSKNNCRFFSQKWHKSTIYICCPPYKGTVSAVNHITMTTFIPCFNIALSTSTCVVQRIWLGQTNPKSKVWKLVWKISCKFIGSFKQNKSNKKARLREKSYEKVIANCLKLQAQSPQF